MGQTMHDAGADAAASPVPGARGAQRRTELERSSSRASFGAVKDRVVRRLAVSADALWGLAAAAVLVVAAVVVVVVDPSLLAAIAAVVALVWAFVRVVIGRRSARPGAGVDAAPFLGAADALVVVALLCVSPRAAVLLGPLLCALVVAAGTFGGRGAGAATAALAAAGAVVGFAAAPDARWPGPVSLALAATFALVAWVVAATEAPSERRRREARTRAEAVRAVRDLFDPTRIRGDLDALLDAAGAAADVSIPADGHVLWLRNGAELSLTRTWGDTSAGERLAAAFASAIGAHPGALEDATASGALVVENTDSLGGPLRRLVRDAGAAAICAVPVRHADVTYGVLAALRGEGTAFDRDDAVAAAACGEAIGVALAAAHVLAAHRSELARLRRLDRVRATFLSTVSTELRDPVTLVAGFARTLIDADHRFRRVERLRYLEIIERHGLDVARLIGDMVIVQDAVSGVASSTPPRFVPTRLSVLAADVAAALGPTSAPVSCAADGVVVVDAARIVQAMTDLVAAATAVTNGSVDARIEAHDTWVRFLVTATGPHSQELDLARVLTAIANGDAETAWSGTATLAMASAHVVVSDHGTRLGASDGDGGRYLWFDLWLEQAASALPAAGAVPDESAGVGDPPGAVDDADDAAIDLAAAERRSMGGAVVDSGEIEIVAAPPRATPPDAIAPLPSGSASVPPLPDLPYS